MSPGLSTFKSLRTIPPGVTTALNTIFGVRNLPNKINTDPRKNVTKRKKLVLGSMESSFSRKDLNEIQANWSQIMWSKIPPDAPQYH